MNMPKPNTYVQLLNAQKRIKQLEENIKIMRKFTLQHALDISMIALHDEFQFGPKYEARFEDAFRRTIMEYAEMCVSDGEDDPEIVYTKEKVDRALRAACGDIIPFDERYAPENLHFRDKLKGSQNEESAEKSKKV